VNDGGRRAPLRADGRPQGVGAGSRLGEGECDDYIGLPSGISFSEALFGPIPVGIDR
jgi:hypothetical protein